MAYELARALLLAEIVSPQAVERALHASVAANVTFPRALLDTGAVEANVLDDMLSRVEAPFVRTVTPLTDLVARLPPGLCARLLAVPIRRDPATGIVDVAVADARDRHAATEIEHHLGLPVRLIRAPMALIEEALARKSRTLPPQGSIRPSMMSMPQSFAPPRAPNMSHLQGSHAPRAPVTNAVDQTSATRVPTATQQMRHPGMGIIPAVIPERRPSAPKMPAVAPPTQAGAQQPTTAAHPAPATPAQAAHAHAAPAYGAVGEAPRVPSLTPPWGTVVSGMGQKAQSSYVPQLSKATQMMHTQFDSQTQQYPSVPDPEQTRPADLAAIERGFAPQSASSTAIPPPLTAGHGMPPSSSIPPPHTERTPAVERPIPLSRMSSAPRSRGPMQYERHPTSLPHASYEAEPLPSFIPGPPPHTARGAQNPGFPFADGTSVIAALRHAEDRDQVLELVLLGARAVARKVAVFVVKRVGLVGWTCSPEFGDRTQLQALLVPLTIPSIFTTAMNEGLYLGAIRHDEVHAPILAVMGGASRDVAIAPIRVQGKAAVVIVADELGDTMIATRRLEEIARAAGEAFTKIVKTRR